MKRNHYGIEVDSEVPITGVIQSNRVAYLYEETLDAIDVGYEEYIRNCPNRQDDGDYECDDPIYLVGFIVDGENEYIPDPKTEFSAIVGMLFTQIVTSKYVSRCTLCSPCFPGQGDLTEEGKFLTFTFPVNIWNEDKHLEILEIINET